MSKDEYSIRLSSSMFVLDRMKSPRHPMIVHRNGKIVLPTADYFHFRRTMENASSGSLKDEAYILCAWLNYLHRQRRDWQDGRDEDFQRYALRREAEGSSISRIMRCIGVVFRFYYVCEFRLELIRGVVAAPNGARAGARPPISVVYSKRGLPQSIFRYATVPAGPGRPTPSEGQVESIYDELFAREDSERATCFWLAASLMHRSGLRRQGVAGLRLSRLAEALQSEGIRLSDRPYDLAAVAAQPDAQQRIMHSLAEMGRLGRTKLFVEVTEKGSKTRLAPIPRDLFESILGYIWIMRADMIESVRRKRINYSGSDFLLISRKTGGGFKEASIGNLINLVFKKLEVPGSAHRLRASFAENVVRDSYLRSRAVHGSAWDGEAVLLEAAEALGHKSTRSLRPYLHRIMREHLIVPGEAVLVTSREDALIFRALSRAVNLGHLAVADRLCQLVREFDL